MTDRLRLLAQLALAALLAAAAGGLILTLLLALAAGGVGAVEDGGAGMVAAAPRILAMVLIGGGIAIGPAVGAGWLPAFAAGAALWAAGRRRQWARRRSAWALAGAAAALACYVRAFPSGTPGPSPFDLFALPPAALAPAFMVAGAAAGQVFRSAMAATAPFFGFEEDAEA